MAELARPALAIVGGLVGGWPGYIAGSLLGGLLFPPAGGVKPEDLASIKIAGPTPGTPVPILIGQRRLRGYTVWAGPISEHSGGKKGGGGGAKKGGGGETTYTRSWLDILCEGLPSMTLLRIWNGDDVLWDAANPGPGTASGIDFTFYPGSDFEAPDPRMAAYQSGGGNTTTQHAESAVIASSGGFYTAQHTPILAGSDSVWYERPGEAPGSAPVRVLLTRVAGTPGVNQYSVNLTTGVFTVGPMSGSESSYRVTFLYRTATATSAQEALGYPLLCKVYVHEFNMGATKTKPQLTYEVCAKLTGGYGVE
jgi:hypothetical protein